MAENLDIVVSLIDQASVGLKSFDDKLKSVTATAQQVGAGMTVLGGIITGVAALSIKAFQQQEQAETRLVQIAKEVTGATQEQIKVLTDQASALQRIGIIGDEVTISAQSELASFALTTEQIKALTPALLDTIAAKQGYNATTESAIALTGSIGKAFTMGASALTRLNITLSDQQKAAFDASEGMDRVRLLSEILEGNYGGLNEAMRATSEGGMKGLKDSFGDLQEMLGAALIPMLTNLVGQVTPIVEKMMAWIEANQDLVDKFVPIIAVVGALMLVLGPILVMLPGIIAAFSLFGMVIGVLLGPVGLVILIIAALIALGVVLWNNWDQIKEFFVNAWDTIKGAFETAIGSIRAYVEEHFGFLLSLFEFWWSAVTSIFNVSISILTAVWSAFWEAFTGLATAVWEIIKTVFTGAFTVLKSIFDTQMENLKKAWDTVWETFGPTVTNIFEGIKSGVKIMINFVIGMINNLIAGVNLVASSLNNIPGVNLTQLASIPLLAKGGNIQRAGSAIVGERGPELVNLPRGAQVSPLGGSGVTLNVYVDKSVITSEDQIMELVGNPIMNVLKQHFSIV